MADKAELAWAAGFFDGEGSTFTTGHKSLQLGIQQIEPLTLHRFRSAVGAGKISGPYKPSRPGQCRYFYSATGVSTVQFILGQMWPWLSPPKRSQAVEALRTYVCRPKNRFNFRGIRHGG